MYSNNIKTHKLTNQRMELIENIEGVSRLYLLDSEGKRIPCTKDSAGGAFDAQGKQSFERVICNNKNLI